MYFTLKALSHNLLLPPGGPLLLAALGGLLIHRNRHRRAGWVLLIAGLAAGWLLALPAIADRITALAEHYPPLDLTQPTQAQAVVILGGGTERVNAPEYGGPAADAGLLERLAYGAFVAKHTGLPVLVTGAPAEALAMKSSLPRDFAVTPRWVEGQSMDTYENALFSARLLEGSGIKRIILVTSSTHMLRAVHEFQNVGFEVLAAPAVMLAPRETGLRRWLPAPSAMERSHAALYELIGEPMRRLQETAGLRSRIEGNQNIKNR